MRCVLALVLLSGLCLASGLDEVERRFSPGGYGLEPQEIVEFKTVQDVSDAISGNRDKVFSAYDFAYLVGMRAVDTPMPFYRALGLLERQARSLSFGPAFGIADGVVRITGKDVFGKSRLFGYINAKRIVKPASYLVLAALWDRPTPTGLKVASGECIRIALEDYAFALDNGADENSLFMGAAAEDISEALGIYSRYTGIIDAEALSLAGASPEGFGRLTGLCSSAIENIESAFSDIRKERAAGAVVVG